MGHSLDDLALLVDAVRAGGVRAVARAQGLPRSTVSRRLQRLEQALGVTLTRRGSGRLELTDAAQASFERLAHLVDEARELSEELGDRSLEPRGVLRLATTPVFAEHVLPTVMAKYLAANPQVRVEVHTSAERIDLTAERIDVAIRAGPLEDLTAFTSRRLGSVTTVGLFASPRYVKRRGLPQTIAALADHDLLLATLRPAGGQWVVQRREGRVPVRVLGRVHAASERFLLALCEQGAGIIRAPAYSVADLVRQGKLVPVLERTWVHAEVHVVYPLAAPPRVRAFVELALAELGEARFTTKGGRGAPVSSLISRDA